MINTESTSFAGRATDTDLTIRMIMLPRKAVLLYLTLFAVAVTVYVSSWRAAPALRHDSFLYLETARDLLDGGFDEIPYRTIGYPLFLLATGSVPSPGRVLFLSQLALHLVAIWLGAVALHRAGAGVRLLAAFGILMLLPPYTVLTAAVMTESLTELCLMVAFVTFYMASRHQWSLFYLLICALALACVSLIRPGFQLLAFALAPLVLVPLSGSFRGRGFPAFRYRFAYTIAFIGVAMLPVLAYSAFNLRKFGFFGMTPLLGHNLAVRAVPFYSKLRASDIVQILRNEHNRLTAAGMDANYAVFEKHRDLLRRAGGSRVELCRDLRSAASTLIRRNKFEYLREVARSFAGYWFPKESYGHGLRVGEWWKTPTRELITFPDYRGIRNLLPLPGPVKAISKLIELAVALLFFAGLLVSVRLISTAWFFGTSPFPTELPSLIAYAAAGAIVLYNAVICCAVDAGYIHQRGSTEVFMVLSVLLLITIARKSGWVLLRLRSRDL